MGARMTNGTCPGFEDVMMMMPDANDTCPADQCIIDQNGECGHPPLTMHAYIVPVILALITLIGLVGNSIVVFVIFYQGQLKTVTNYYIVNLAITDLAFLIACAPFTAALYATKDWMFGRFMCKFVFYLQQMTAQTTCITLVLLAIDRYKIIMHPIESLYKRTEKRFCFVVLVIWISSGLLAAPLISVFDLKVELIECEHLLVYCTEQWEVWETKQFKFDFWHRSYVIYTALVIYVIPLLVISVCYSIILSHLWKQELPTDDSEAVLYQKRVVYRRRRTVTRMVLAVMFAFAICWFPIHVMNIWSRFDPCFYIYHDNSLVTAMMGVAHGLIYLNSSINPILYAILGGNFRHHLRQMLARNPKMRKQSTSSIQHPHARLLGTKTTQI
ncbi:G-protein coupled receptor 54-like isoform X1 [Amphiura filiformis]|uniref:G-protein coupled receptor 54-like isoform X1 n=1 Tax=Amphiura filiformis TaxID=82378 RepID=UPI003B228F31